MDDTQLRDEVVLDRIRAAEEFLDPSMPSVSPLSYLSNDYQTTQELDHTAPISLLCSIGTYVV
jgi:hypothetical protein